jgi:hypothetical protein
MVSFTKALLAATAGASDIARVVNQLQGNLETLFAFLLDQPFFTRITGVSLSSGPNLVATGLGKPFTGWWISDSSAAAIVYRTPYANFRYLQLVSTAPCVVDVMVW